jgi:hypothetical protein
VGKEETSSSFSDSYAYADIGNVIISINIGEVRKGVKKHYIKISIFDK